MVQALNQLMLEQWESNSHFAGTINPAKHDHSHEHMQNFQRSFFSAYGNVVSSQA